MDPACPNEPGAAASRARAELACAVERVRQLADRLDSVGSAPAADPGGGAPPARLETDESRTLGRFATTLLRSAAVLLAALVILLAAFAPLAPQAAPPHLTAETREP